CDTFKLNFFYLAKSIFRPTHLKLCKTSLSTHLILKEEQEHNMVRSASCEKNSVVKRGAWMTEEDGSGSWNSVPKKNRLRWSNNVVDDKLFTSEEEDLIVKLHSAIGSRWSIIAQQLPGRTNNDVKNNWNTKLEKKLSQMGIDPVTHKPFLNSLLTMEI
ncbi:hypothetical protein RYX36_016773, partial [Vicia faba]